MALMKKLDGGSSKDDQRHMYMSVNSVMVELNLEFALWMTRLMISGGFLGLVNEKVLGQVACMMSSTVIVGLMMWVPITCFTNLMERRMVNGVVTKSR